MLDRCEKRERERERNRQKMFSDKLNNRSL